MSTFTDRITIIIRDQKKNPKFYYPKKITQVENTRPRFTRAHTHTHAKSEPKRTQIDPKGPKSINIWPKLAPKEKVLTQKKKVLTQKKKFLTQKSIKVSGKK